MIATIYIIRSNWDTTSTTYTTNDTTYTTNDTNYIPRQYYYKEDEDEKAIKSMRALDRIIDTLRYFHPVITYWVPHRSFKSFSRLSVLLCRWLK